MLNQLIGMVYCCYAKNHKSLYKNSYLYGSKK